MNPKKKERKHQYKRTPYEPIDCQGWIGKKQNEKNKLRIGAKPSNLGSIFFEYKIFNNAKNPNVK